MADSASLKVETNLPVPMRDGTVLYADVYRPEGPGTFPVLLERTPYDKSFPPGKLYLELVRAASSGYALVIQDTRGRYSSEGQFYCFRDDISDGYDTVEWCAAQPWSTGKVGMFGSSYVGITQWLAAKARPPHLVAIFPRVTGSNFYDGWVYQGGAFEMGLNCSWTMDNLSLANFKKIASQCNVTDKDRETLIEAIDNLDQAFRFMPLKDLPYLKNGVASFFYDWLEHPTYDDYWRQLSIGEDHNQIEVAAYNLGCWYDVLLGGTLSNYTGLRQKGHSQKVQKSQKLIVTPWNHTSGSFSMGSTMSGERYSGVAADAGYIDLDGIQLRWFDYWLKGIDNGIMDEPPVKIFVMGDNIWRNEEEWPLQRAEYVNYYLHSSGRANTLNGDGAISIESPGTEPPDVFLYNPRDPVPTRGGGLCCNAYFLAGGAFDNREVERRSDVLVYSTPSLDREVEVTGPITVTLWAASNALDTDFTAKLLDVCPCGVAHNLTDGIIRARYRDSFSAPSLLEPGEVYKYTIDLWATSNVFKRGHQIRVEVSSSNFPRFARNTNTGNLVAEDASFKPAMQTILHDSQHPSHITLPIVPR